LSRADEVKEFLEGRANGDPVELDETVDFACAINHFLPSAKSLAKNLLTSWAKAFKKAGRKGVPALIKAQATSTAKRIATATGKWAGETDAQWLARLAKSSAKKVRKLAKKAAKYTRKISKKHVKEKAKEEAAALKSSLHVCLAPKLKAALAAHLASLAAAQTSVRTK